MIIFNRNDDIQMFKLPTGISLLAMTLHYLILKISIEQQNKIAHLLDK